MSTESAGPTVEMKPSVCPMDCPDRCSLQVGVKNDLVVSIDAGAAHDVTGGFICTKVRRFARRLYGPDRVLYPQRRSGAKGSGRFVRISWEEALREIAARLQGITAGHGAEAVLPFAYGGSNGMLSHEFVDAHFFRRLGASRLERTLCAASTTAAQDALYGKMPGTAFDDYPEARFILIWGASPTQSNIHLMPYLKKARRRGVKIAMVDPRRMLGDELVDFWLQPYPGTDVAVALAMIHHLNRHGLVDRAFLRAHSTGWEQLLEYAQRFPVDVAARIARVEPSDIVRIAEAYAEADPAILRCGWGLERNRNGLAAVASVLSLPAVAGKFGVAGGGFSLSASKAYGLDDTELAGAPESATRKLNMNRLGRYLNGELAPPPLKALFVYNCNPAATVPDHNRVLAGLRREDLFTVVHDQVLTDTALFADIVLPATTFLEHRELSKSYGTYALQFAEPVVAPLGEAKPNAELFQLLGRAMGWTDGLFGKDADGLLASAVGALKGSFQQPFAIDMLKERRIAHFDFPGPRPVQFVTVFPNTPDRKIRLYAEALGPEPYKYTELEEDGAYPLALISPASGKSISSSMAEYNLLDVKAEMHPDDAAARSLVEGSTVRIFNALGEVVCGLHLDARIKPGVVSLAKGIWRRATLNGSVGNALVPDTLTPVSGGACFNDTRVQVEGSGTDLS
jgi:anaerobic selenocysteine-containing dehydrogenase